MRRRIAATAFGVVAAGLLGEAGARTIIGPPVVDVRPSDDFHLIYEVKPNPPEVNRLGMHQDELDPAALAGRFVIAAIGDSHTFGLVHRDETFPARLEHYLNEDEAGKFAVLNFGVGGYNMVQEFEVLRAKALRFHPDLVILQYTINDDHISNYIAPAHPTLNRLVHHSRLLSGTWMNLLYSEEGRSVLLPAVEEWAPDLLLYTPGLVGTPRSRDPDPRHQGHPTRDPRFVPEPYHDFIGRDNFVDALRRFGEICRQRGIPALATGFIEDADKPLYLESSFAVVDSFFDIFRGLDFRQYGYDPRYTWMHFDARGNDIVGRALARDIRAISAYPKRYVYIQSK